jgi:hypothetical protein
MYIPKASLEVTVKDQDGKVLLTKIKEYSVYDLHFEDNKEGYLGMSNFDITAQHHINLGLEPHQTDSITEVLPLAIGTKSVTVEATFNYLYEEGDRAVIKTASKTVEF